MSTVRASALCCAWSGHYWRFQVLVTSWMLGILLLVLPYMMTVQIGIDHLV